jgi:hypothetical protein
MAMDCYGLVWSSMKYISIVAYVCLIQFVYVKYFCCEHTKTGETLPKFLKFYEFIFKTMCVKTGETLPKFLETCSIFRSI